MDEKATVNSFWNGKNINGNSHVGDDLIKESDRNNDKIFLKYEVGGDTISADDLQKGLDYDQL